jgi:hypothetical protein
MRQFRWQRFEQGLSSAVTASGMPFKHHKEAKILLQIL